MYVLEAAGATILQLFSVILQYNFLVGKIAQQTAENVDSFNPRTAATNLSGHLRVMSGLIDEAEQKIAPIHNATIH